MHRLKLVLSASLFLCLAGCVSSGVKVDQDKVTALQPGVTTYSQALALLGKPTNSAMSSDGTRTISYSYFQAQANAASFIPYVGAFVGGSNSESTTLTVNFDKNLILTTYNSTQGQNNVGTGIISGQRQQ